MAKVTKYVYSDGDVALEYPECPYYRAFPNAVLESGGCKHKGARYLYCCTHHVIGDPVECPFDSKEVQNG